MPVTTRTQSKGSLTITEKQQQNLLGWFVETMAKYIKDINDYTNGRKDIKKLIDDNQSNDIALSIYKTSFINSHFDQIRILNEMLNTIVRYYPIFDLTCDMEKFGVIMYKKLIYFYDECHKMYFRLGTLTQSEKEEEFKLLNILLDTSIKLENIIAKRLTISIDFNVYEQLQQSKESFKRFINTSILEKETNKTYNLRNRKQINYTGMDTIEPECEDDGITYIWYDCTLSYDDNYNPNNLEDRAQVLLDELDDQNYYEYVVDEY